MLDARLCIAALAPACAPFPMGPRVTLPDAAPPVHHGVVADDALAAAVDEAALAFLADSGLPAIAVAVERGGQPVFSAGYGWADLETERPLEAETPILLSSVSKTFVGVAAMQAVEDGSLALDDPIGDLVGFAVDNPFVDGEVIALRHALTHNTGIEDAGAYDDSYVEGDPTVGLEAFERGYLTEGGAWWHDDNFSDSAPGTEFSYSNVGAGLAGLAVGQASGLELADFVAERILEPLGMLDSAYFLADLRADPAVPYRRVVPWGGFKAYPQYGFPTYPDGLMRSSASDLARYLAAFDGGGVLDGEVILSEASVDEMLTIDRGAGTDEDGQAIAWSMRKMGGRELYGHNGGDYGSTAELWIDTAAGVGEAVVLNVEVPERHWDALIELQLELLDLAEGR